MADVNAMLQVGVPARPYSEADYGFFGYCPETFYMNPNERVVAALEWNDEVIRGITFRFQRLVPIRTGMPAIFTISLGLAELYPDAPSDSIFLAAHTFRGNGINLECPFEELVADLEKARYGEVVDDGPPPRSFEEALYDLNEQAEIARLYKRGASVSGENYRIERAS